MTTKRIIIFLSVYLTYYLCSGQINILDSCGVNSIRQLNQYEITIVDSLLFSPYQTKKSGVIDPKNGFNFKDKKIAFFSCTTNSNTNGDGLLSKKEFFGLFKPAFTGHAGIGLIVFSENEKRESKGFDAVIIVDCPYDRLMTKDLISKMIKKYD